MQLVSRYLVNNRVDVIANEAGFVTEYKPVYQRQLKIYKGIDNNVQFRLLNADQKPINVASYTPKFVAFDENMRMVVEKTGTNVGLDDSSATRGLFQITISENDLLNVKTQYLTYNIYLVDNATNAKVLTYSNSYFDGCGTIYVDSCQWPGPSPTFSISTFVEQTSLESASVWYSETLDAQPAINGNEALHTVAIYTDGYKGNLFIQATLDNQVTDGTAWADIDTVTFTGGETMPYPVNFNGVFSHIRFKTDKDPADKITKILVRN